MVCRDAENLILTDQIDGELKGESLRELEKHLVVCSACRELQERVAGTETILRGLAKTPPPERVWSVIQERITADSSFDWAGVWEAVASFFEEPRRFAIAATLATTVIIVGVMLPGMLSPSSSQESDLFLAEATRSGVYGAVLPADDELWSESVDHFLL